LGRLDPTVEHHHPPAAAAGREHRTCLQGGAFCSWCDTRPKHKRGTARGAHRVVSSGIEITPTRTSFSQRTIKEIKLTCVHGKSLVFSGSKPGVALVDDCDTSLSCDMSVKLTVTRINRATGRRKESCEDPQRAPIAQEQHTSSIRFPQGGGYNRAVLSHCRRSVHGKSLFSPEGARLQALQPPAVASNPTVDDVARIGVFGAGQYVRAALWRGSRQ
jgi:hypothetical protein